MRARSTMWLVTASLVPLLGGCVRWEPVPVGPTLVEHGTVRVTKVDRSRVELRNPSIQGDSIVGDSVRVLCGKQGQRCAELAFRKSIAVRDVLKVSARPSDGDLARGALSVVLDAASLAAGCGLAAQLPETVKCVP